MGEKDMAERTLESYNDVFADILNVLLFNGEQRVKPEELEEVQTFSQYKADDEKLHEQERDTAKAWKHMESRIAMFGVEDQTIPDPDMPLRIMGYDGAGYRSQLLGEEKKKARYPVISIVLYFGTGLWKNTKLADCFEIPEGLEVYVNDYRINLFEIAKLPMETVNKFTSDFRIVAEFFVMTARGDEEYHPTSQPIKHVDEVLKLLRVMTGDPNIDQLFTVEKKEGGTEMESYFTKMYKKGIGQGIEQGEGKRLIELICKKLRRGMDVEQIAREVEEDEPVVQEIVDIAEEFFPDYPADAVFQAVQKGKKEKQEKKQLADV